jgi:hypothetical protein
LRRPGRALPTPEKRRGTESLSEKIFRAFHPMSEGWNQVAVSSRREPQFGVSEVGAS